MKFFIIIMDLWQLLTLHKTIIKTFLKSVSIEGGTTTELYSYDQMTCKIRKVNVESRERGSILTKLSLCQMTVGWLQFLRSDWSCSRWEGGVGVRC